MSQTLSSTVHSGIARTHFMVRVTLVAAILGFGLDASADPAPGSVQTYLTEWGAEHLEGLGIAPAWDSQDVLSRTAHRHDEKNVNIESHFCTTGIPENEPDCGSPVDTVNGGCYYTPFRISPIECGQTICGTSRWDGASRDTDWYQLVISQQRCVTWRVNAQFPVLIAVLHPPCPPTLAGTATAAAGVDAVLSLCLAPGTYYLLVTPQFISGGTFGCGLEYTAKAECDPCPCCIPPGIEMQPVDETACAGSSATFSVIAYGTQPLSYQWYAGLTPSPATLITGATGSSYTISPVGGEHVSYYTVVVSNACGSVTSHAAFLTVLYAPFIVTGPSSRTVCAGNSTTFSVDATGGGLQYQWYFKNAIIAGANASTYTIPAVAPGDDGAYTVSVTNACGSALSAPATLSVHTAPVITLPPVNVTSPPGGMATFSVGFTGNPLPTVQWQFKGVNLVNGGNISGATSPTLTINPVTYADQGTYTAVVSNACGTSDGSAQLDVMCCDSVQWSLRTSGGHPASHAGAMAFDSARGVCVQVDQSGVWEWNGTAWTQRSGLLPGMPLSRHCMAYDTVRQRVITYGGGNSSAGPAGMWEWDGAAPTWTPLSVAFPGSRDYAAIAYMSNANPGRLVLFGGQSGTLKDDTWEYAGSTWQQRPGIRPPARLAHAMAYDPVRNVIIMFGGFDGTSSLGDTWEYRNIWTLVSSSGPTPRYGHAMAYDVTCQMVVLFGGHYGPSGPLLATSTNSIRSVLSDTWGWDAAASEWRLLVPAGGGPSGRYVPNGLVYDSVRERLVLFGGLTSAGWGSQTWEARANSVPGNDHCAAAFDVPAGTYGFSTCDATSDGPADCPIDDDLWYTYRPKCSGTVTVDTCGSLFDTSLAVYTGTCGSLALVACNDDAPANSPCGGSGDSFVSFSATANTDYRIRIGGPGTAGTGRLTINGPYPSNPTCPTPGNFGTRLYRVTGPPTGTPWAWNIGAACCTNIYSPNVPGVLPSAGTAGLVAAFVADINNRCPGFVVARQYAGAMANTFSVAVRDCSADAAFVLRVGAAGTPADQLCTVVTPAVPTSGPCSFNPQIVEVPLSGEDCNANGEDDLLDLLSGTSLDLNANGLPDECELLGDLDGDGDVDADDFAIFAACATGPVMPYDPSHLPPGCLLWLDAAGFIAPDFDRDGDVDQSDFAVFQRCWSGEGIPAELGCANYAAYWTPAIEDPAQTDP